MPRSPRKSLCKRLQKEDKDLRGVRAELKLIGTRLEKTKKEIRDADIGKGLG